MAVHTLHDLKSMCEPHEDARRDGPTARRRLVWDAVASELSKQLPGDLDKFDGSERLADLGLVGTVTTMVARALLRTFPFISFADDAGDRLSTATDLVHGCVTFDDLVNAVIRKVGA